MREAVFILAAAFAGFVAGYTWCDFRRPDPPKPSVQIEAPCFSLEIERNE